MIQVLITKSTSSTSWYSNKIGQVLDAYDTDHERWYIIANGLWYIRKDDTEIFDRKKKLERIIGKL